MTKWYIYELSAFILAVTALFLGAYVAGWFYIAAAVLGGAALAFWAVEEEAERTQKHTEKRTEGGIESNENEFEKWIRENGYEGMLY